MLRPDGRYFYVTETVPNHDDVDSKVLHGRAKFRKATWRAQLR